MLFYFLFIFFIGANDINTHKLMNRTQSSVWVKATAAAAALSDKSYLKGHKLIAFKVVVVVSIVASE